MEIPPDLKFGGLRLPGSAAELRNWRVGQVLSAVATGRDRAGFAPLRIGVQTYTAQVPFPVRSGDRLVLEVLRTGTTPLLRPVDAPRSPDPVQAALRAALPRQAGQPPVLATLAALAGAREIPTLPTPVLQAARQVFATLLDAREVRLPGRLRQAMGDAGTLLESRLARQTRDGPPAGVDRDLKAGLLRLYRALAAGPAPGPRTPSPPGPVPAPSPINAAPPRTAAGAPPQPPNSTAARPTPPLLPPLADVRPQPQARAAAPLLSVEALPRLLGALLQDVEGALARVQLQQLASQASEGEQRHVWLLEVPIRRDGVADVWQFRIQRDAEDGSEDADGGGWTLELAFDLDGLGPVRARMQLQAGHISTRFWAEWAATAGLFRGALHELRTMLEAAGVPIGTLVCHNGTPPAGGRCDSAGLLDERA